MEKQKQVVIEKIIRLRLAQILVNERYKNGDFKIPIHLALGHESLAVAVDASMMDNDHIFLTHRNIHYNLARIDTLKDEIDEYYLKVEGVASGHLGSMNLSNPDRNIVYSSSILGNNLPVSTGFALGNTLNNNSGVTFVVTGDGAIEEGAFYESLIFMKSNDLSTIIINENNNYSLGTKIDERRCKIDLSKIASSVDVEHIQLSGNDPFEYIETITAARIKSLELSSPIILEVHLTTLGQWYLKTEKFPDGELINYHAGPAPTIEMSDYPLILSTNEDPLFILEQYLSKKELIKICSKLLKHIKLELQ